MMITMNRVQTFVMIAIFHSEVAAIAFHDELDAKPFEEGVMALHREGTRVVWRVDDPARGRSWGRDFEARWMQTL